MRHETLTISFRIRCKLSFRNKKNVLNQCVEEVYKRLKASIKREGAKYWVEWYNIISTFNWLTWIFKNKSLHLNCRCFCFDWNVASSFQLVLMKYLLYFVLNLSRMQLKLQKWRKKSSMWRGPDAVGMWTVKEMTLSTKHLPNVVISLPVFLFSTIEQFFHLCVKAMLHGRFVSESRCKLPYSQVSFSRQQLQSQTEIFYSTK